jgi:hypothetical protein
VSLVWLGLVSLLDQVIISHCFVLKTNYVSTNNSMQGKQAFSSKAHEEKDPILFKENVHPSLGG